MCLAGPVSRHGRYRNRRVPATRSTDHHSVGHAASLSTQLPRPLGQHLGIATSSAAIPVAMPQAQGAEKLSREGPMPLVPSTAFHLHAAGSSNSCEAAIGGLLKLSQSPGDRAVSDSMACTTLGARVHTVDWARISAVDLLTPNVSWSSVQTRLQRRHVAGCWLHGPYPKEVPN